MDIWPLDRHISHLGSKDTARGGHIEQGVLAATRAQLDEATFAAAWAEGRAR